MGFDIPPFDELNMGSYRQKATEKYNCRVALWQLPYSSAYRDFDTDNSHWFEAVNKNNENEIEAAEEGLKKSFSQYKVYTKKVDYIDGSTEEISKYPSGNKVKVLKGLNSVFATITDSLNRKVVEKLYDKFSNEGRKVIYKYAKQGENNFKLIQIYSYDITKNKATDIINYGYNSSTSALIKGCKLQKEYCELNGSQINFKKINEFEYEVTDKNGQKLTFLIK